MLSDALKKRIDELLARYARQDIPLSTGFLTPAEREDAAAWLRREPAVRFSGGYPGAERQILLLLPSWQEEEGAVGEALAALRITAPDSLNHRDYLGALLGLGVDRSCIGDILVGNGGAELIVLSRMAEYFRENITAVGRYGASASIIPLSELHVPERRSERVRRTVPQLRLDCVGAAAFSLSRGKMGALIDQGAVQLRHEVCFKREKPVSEGDAISVRGMGKAIVAAIGGKTGKDRIWVEIERLS